MVMLSIIWLVLVAVLTVRARRRQAVFKELTPSAPPRAELPKVLIIVPARNEAENIGNCLKALLAQAYPAGRMRIATIDDNSTDSTAQMIAALAASSAVIEPLAAPSLPHDWTGKSHACWCAARAALRDEEWLCFIDADVVAAPCALAAAVSHALGEGIDVLSLVPRQRLVGFAERLVLPCGFYFLGFTQNSRPANGAEGAPLASGMFMLIGRSAYLAIGGHKAVRGEICEDLAMAVRAREHGFKTVLLGSSELLSTRMYRGWTSLWPGVTKNLAAMLGGPAPAAAAAVVALTLAWAAPLLPAFAAGKCFGRQGTCTALAFAAPASAAAFALHIAGAAHFRIPLWYGLVFPLGYTVGAALALDSARRLLAGKVRWKGRVYAGRRQPQKP